MSILESLRIDPTVLLANGVLFLVLLAILNAIFWKPMMRHLEQRRDDIRHAYRTVDETRRQLEGLRAEYQHRLARIESDARARIQQTVREAQSERERMLTEARDQSAQIVAEGARGIDQEKEQTLTAMRGGLDDVALDALAKALGMTPTDAHRRLVDEYIAQNVLRS